MGDGEENKGIGIEVINMYLDMFGKLNGMHVPPPGLGTIVLPTIQNIERWLKITL